jgi:hypothetical protein
MIRTGLALIAIAGALLSATAQVLAATLVPDPQALLVDIEREGARPVLSRLWADHQLFEAITGRVALGSAAWLEVARRLRPASDAAASLSLDFAVARALHRAPSRVLPMIGGDFRLRFICTSPYIEAPLSVDIAHLRAVERTLSNFRTTKYAAVKAQCLAEIQRLLSELMARAGAAQPSVAEDAPQAARR